MCVIIVKPKGVELPTDLLLYKAARRNHDGCGYVASNGEYHRTLSFDRFAISFYKNVKKEDAAIIHFRWATQGSVAVRNCHPFFKCGIYFAHNGVLPYRPYKDITDSQFAFERYLLPHIEHWGYDRQYIDDIRGGSRFAFMQDGEIRLYGNFVERDGLLLSNTNFMY